MKIYTKRIAMAVFLRFLLQASLLGLWLLSSCLENTYAKEPGEGQQYSHSHIVSVSSLLPSTVCNRSRKAFSRKDSLELVHKNGPCSELNQGKVKTLSWSEILLKDQARVRSINFRRRYMNSDGNRFEQTKSKNLPFGYDYAIGGGEYYAKVDIGTPGQSNYVLLDTGSGVTWIQCKPCARCFKQPGPIFDPSKSSSYSTLPCNSSKCNLLASPKRGCASNKCSYRIGYGDGSFSKGYFVKDKLTFPTADRKSKVIINNYMLGCGQNNSDTISESSIGLMGLSRVPTSFVYQTAPLFKKYFSYCLPSDYSSTGYLTFGKPDDLNKKNIKFTPIPTTPEQSQFYDVNITGISVSGKKLPIKSSVYAAGSGTILDSGTEITQLQPKVYAALRSAFRKGMTQYKFVGANGNTDTCYDFTGHEAVEIPQVSFYFKGGVKLDVNFNGIMLPKDEKSVCLAFLASDEGDITVLGNIMQRTVQVVHDVEGRRIGFIPGACA